MSEGYDNSNSGALFKNKRQKTPKHPNYTGSLNVDGKDYWLAAWIKKSKKGETFMSLSIQPKDEEPPQKAPVKEEDASQVPPSDEDDIPF